METENKKNKLSCYSPMESCIHSRRCFMTGEYCSKQPNIQRERKAMHETDKFKIRAFVVMNFSDMSDVVYKWRLRPFIESLSKYLYFKDDKLYCSVSDRDSERNEHNAVTEIEVVRSDSDPASNYVVCSRICQQMQIADLVVVDVTNQNANVFYEFGMAVALQKMILPICYSESFYKMVVPDKLKNVREEDLQKIEHHIGNYPWRKDLFEYYGIRFKIKVNQQEQDIDSQTKYLEFTDAVKSEYGFSDSQYDRFPYHEKLDHYAYKIGKVIYDQLKEEYDNASYDDNTLVVYTMDGFLNEEQAGRCIVNFYHNIVLKMKTESCFCGERVGVLVQGNVIPESEKDTKEKLDIAYSVGEIIQIGTNQATYLAAEEKIKSDDDWTDLLGHVRPVNKDVSEPSAEQKKEIERFVKKHITNRAMRIYPVNPVFVDRMKNLLDEKLLDKIDGAFYLYYVMLRTLRHTNEIVVDVSNNCLQSLFWLGAAHGLDVHAITVMHEKTDPEKRHDENEKENRYVFDVAGLWMAILRKNDTEGFYAQLAAAQSGIERHSKLMLPNSKYTHYKKQLKEYLFALDKYSGDEKAKIVKLKEDQVREEKRILESYYRDRFWTPMLGYNQLSIYLSHRNERGENAEPKLGMSKWDFDTVSVLSQYLSKRKIIGEYSLVSSIEKGGAPDAEKLNFICVGSESQPLDKSLSHYIYEQLEGASPGFEDQEGVNIVHGRDSFPDEKEAQETPEFDLDCKKYFKGFSRIERIEDGKVIYSDSGIYTHQPKTQICANCSTIKENGKSTKPLFDKNDAIKKRNCQFGKFGRHVEIAQLLLWRENSYRWDQRSYFRVGIIGSSGPATYALSSLFVSEEQVEKRFGFEKPEGGEDVKLLCELQCIARRKFIEVFQQKLKKEVEEVLSSAEGEQERKGRYCRLVEHAAVYYLKTVLYRYFFPFLSERDMERMYSGMYMFINSMKAVKVSPFALNKDFGGRESCVRDDHIKEIVDRIPKLLLGTLKSFRGLEVFYEVEVEHALENAETVKDTRSVKSIKMVKTGNDEKPYINYFFTDMQNADVKDPAQ